MLRLLSVLCGFLLHLAALHSPAFSTPRSHVFPHALEQDRLNRRQMPLLSVLGTICTPLIL